MFVTKMCKYGSLFLQKCVNTAVLWWKFADTTFFSQFFLNTCILNDRFLWFDSVVQLDLYKPALTLAPGGNGGDRPHWSPAASTDQSCSGSRSGWHYPRLFRMILSQVIQDQNEIIPDHSGSESTLSQIIQDQGDIFPDFHQSCWRRHYHHWVWTVSQIQIYLYKGSNQMFFSFLGFCSKLWMGGGQES